MLSIICYFICLHTVFLIENQTAISQTDTTAPISSTTNENSSKLPSMAITQEQYQEFHHQQQQLQHQQQLQYHYQQLQFNQHMNPQYQQFQEHQHHHQSYNPLQSPLSRNNPPHYSHHSSHHKHHYSQESLLQNIDSTISKIDNSPTHFDLLNPQNQVQPLAATQSELQVAQLMVADSSDQSNLVNSLGAVETLPSDIGKAITGPLSYSHSHSNFLSQLQSQRMQTCQLSVDEDDSVGKSVLTATSPVSAATYPNSTAFSLGALSNNNVRLVKRKKTSSS